MMLNPGRVVPLGLDAPALCTRRSPLDGGGGASRSAGRSIGGGWRTACRRGGGGSTQPHLLLLLRLPLFFSSRLPKQTAPGSMALKPETLVFFFAHIGRAPVQCVRVSPPGYNRCATAVTAQNKNE